MSLKKKIISILNKAPYIRGLYNESQHFKSNSCFPPGHFYSPIISVDDIRKRENEIWSYRKNDGIQGIRLNTNQQRELVKEFAKYYGEIPFTDTKNEVNRYYFNNHYYSYTDAIFLYSMIRHFCPKKIIEIGSGFSSAVMLDINNFFLDNRINLIFIEPFPDRLNSLINDNDRLSTTIIEKNVQDIELGIFEKLNVGDILFVDSTHIVKTGSDVNFILFEIMPRLKSGVLIHFHDIAYPFEYPKEWVFMGRNWNENYFLKAFLMYNNEFEIILFSSYLHTHHKDVFEEMPLCYKNGGGNLWLRKK